MGGCETLTCRAQNCGRDREPHHLSSGPGIASSSSSSESISSSVDISGAVMSFSDLAFSAFPILVDSFVLERKGISRVHDSKQCTHRYSSGCNMVAMSTLMFG